jgi:putative YpdA family bacillithiol system oxidoreductase
VGELGGMGLIRNAMSQGLQAVANLSRELVSATGSPCLDIAIIGAGPAGIAAALACRERGLSHLILDQDGLGGSVNHYPRRKLVMTAPVELPIVGRFHHREIGKEQLLGAWQRIVRQARLEVRAPWRVTDVQREENGFRLVGTQGELRARRVVLAIGRRGSPRKLGVPGEDSPKVAYRLLEPEPFAGLQVLVVGGGNSAVEIALSLADAGANTTLSYRGTAFGRVAPENLARLRQIGAPRLRVLLESEVQCIEPDAVVLRTSAGESRIANDQVFAAIGGELPTQFLERIGVAMNWHHGATPRTQRQHADRRP